MERRRARLTGLLVLVLLAAALAGCGGKGESTAQELVLMLDWFPNADHVPIYVALEKGFFEKEGLKVGIQAPADPNDPLKLAAAGEVDVAVNYEPSVILARAEGLPVVSVGLLVEHPLNTIVFLKESGIQTPADLKGKKIGYSVAPLDEVLFRAVAEKYGLGPQDYELININFNIVPSLLSGQVDAVIGAYWNYELTELKLEGHEADVFRLEEHGIPDYYELVFITSEKTLKERREALAAFVRAMDAALAWTREHPDEALQVYFQANPDVRKELDEGAFRLTLPVFARTQVQEAARWQAFVDFAVEKGLIERPVPVEDLYVNLGK